MLGYVRRLSAHKAQISKELHGRTSGVYTIDTRSYQILLYSLARTKSMAEQYFLPCFSLLLRSELIIYSSERYARKRRYTLVSIRAELCCYVLAACLK